MIQTQSTTWWIHGPAPGGEAFFDAALALADRSITTNAGIFAFLCHRNRQLRPDWYWLSDGTAIETLGRFAVVAEELGSIVASHRNVQDAGIQRPLWFCLTPPCDPIRYIPGQMQHVTLSGMICLQYIANLSKPGDTILMTGMTGYLSSPGNIVADNFHGKMGKAGGAEHNTTIIAPFTQSVVRQLHDRRFVFCGKPHRVFGAPENLDYHNLTICYSAEELAQEMRP